MKIALLTPTFHEFSGIDRLVEGQAKELSKTGHEVHVFTLAGSLKPTGIRVHVLGMPNGGFLQRIYRLLMFLDVFKVSRVGSELAGYDRVVSHLYPMTILGASAKKKNPKIEYVYYNAGVGIVSSYSYFERQYLTLFNAFNNHFVKSCDSAVSISKFLADVLKKETGVTSTVEYISVESKRFNSTVPGSRIVKKHGLGSGPVLLYVGRISPHKGVDLLLKAFTLIKKEFSNAQLVIVGKHTFSGYSKKLKSMNVSGVTFAGFVADAELPEYYAACDVYTTCSLWEGFDIPIVEAFACGKPTVAFSVGSHPEVLKKGKLVAVNDISGFADAVIELLRKKVSLKNRVSFLKV
ncbi:MAG: glycosyltransferase family 4 protein [Nanoarchaeota archaeon]|nr:glycosyltransferase family 4 protein [Nanoarchaeota archaeon]